MEYSIFLGFSVSFSLCGAGHVCILVFYCISTPRGVWADFWADNLRLPQNVQDVMPKKERKTGNGNVCRKQPLTTLLFVNGRGCITTPKLRIFWARAS